MSGKRDLRGAVILTIGHQHFLVRSKSAALAVIGALSDAPELERDFSVPYDRERYDIKPPVEISMKSGAGLKYADATLSDAPAFAPGVHRSPSRARARQADDVQEIEGRVIPGTGSRGGRQAKRPEPEPLRALPAPTPRALPAPAVQEAFQGLLKGLGG